MEGGCTGCISLPLLSPDTSHCAQRHGPHGQDGPRTGWLCWSGTWATSQRSTRWAGEWCLPVPSVWGTRGWQAGADLCCLSGPRSSSASPRPCLPQRTPWKSGGRAWVRERPHHSCPSGVCSREQESICCIGALPHPHSAPLLLTSSSPAPGCRLSSTHSFAPSFSPSHSLLAYLSF